MSSPGSRASPRRAATRWSAVWSARAWRHAGFTGIEWYGLNKTLIAIVLSPMLGMLLSMAIMLGTSWLFRKNPAREADRNFRILHLLSRPPLTR